MKEQFVDYELALKLKKLDFDEECFSLYDEHGVFSSWVNSAQNSKEDVYNTAAPLYQQAFDWFREKYNLSGEPQSDQFKFGFYIVEDTLGKNICKGFGKGFKSYKEARQACLEKIIEIVNGAQIQ